MSIIHCRFYILHSRDGSMNELNMETPKCDHIFDQNNSKFVGSDVFIDIEQRMILCWTEITIKCHIWQIKVPIQDKSQTDLNKKFGVDIRNTYSPNEFRSGKHS